MAPLLASESTSFTLDNMRRFLCNRLQEALDSAGQVVGGRTRAFDTNIGIHLIEGETVTPMLLAKRFTLNPVLVIIALVFWFWMWGIPGAILSVPMLAIAKIICDRVRPLAAFGHFLEG